MLPHSAIITRGYGVPAVATTTLTDDQVVKVDRTSGTMQGEGEDPAEG
jgi:phosphohistidine swiveling domain-containing protein